MNIHRVFNAIRSLHLKISDRGLPLQLAIYGHAVKSEEFTALEECVEHFSALGYKFCTMSDLFVLDGAKRIALSFDDNYQAWHPMLRTLENLRISVTFYVNTLPFGGEATKSEINNYYDRLQHGGDRTPLSVQELCDIAAAGHTIGSHTHSHYMLTRIGYESAIEDIKKGKLVLENILGYPVTDFSFPFGMGRHFNSRLQSYCLSLGFKTIAAAIPGMQHSQRRYPYLHRTMWHLDKSLEFNVANLRIDGKLFVTLTGRSPVG